MTRKEAITQLELLLEYCESMMTSEYPVWRRDREALQMLIAALHPISRERVEKVWRGEWKRRNTQNGIEWFCSECGYVSTPIYQRQDFIPFPENRPMLFCNACGAPMTDEAVKMVMERLEALCGQASD